MRARTKVGKLGIYGVIGLLWVFGAWAAWAQAGGSGGGAAGGSAGVGGGGDGLGGGGRGDGLGGRGEKGLESSDYGLSYHEWDRDDVIINNHGALSRFEIQRRLTEEIYSRRNNLQIYYDLARITRNRNLVYPKFQGPEPPLIKPKEAPIQLDGLELLCGPNAVCGPSDPAAGITPPQSSGETQAGPPPESIVALLKFLGADYFRLSYSFPFVVALLRDSKPVCSGVYLGDGKVLTAAHCTCDEPLSELFFGTSTVAGDATDIGWSHRTQLSDRVDRFHEGYCREDAPGGERALDLAVVRTQYKPEMLSPFAFPWREGVGSLESHGLIVGFGASDHSSSGGVKRLATLKAELCSNEDSERSGCLAGHEYIARNPKGTAVDTCEGDSGGPLLTLDVEKGSYRLAGITSRKIPDGSERYCGSGGIYTSVDTQDVKQWLGNLP